MIKRFFTAIACVFLFAAALAGSALASSSAWQITVGGESLKGSAESPAYATTDVSGNVTIEESFDEHDPWNVKWDGETLTLRDAYVINWYADDRSYLCSGIYELYNTRDIEIVLVGTNAVAGNYYGIYTPKYNLTFSGDGSLAVVCMDNINSKAGIYAASVTVNSGSLTVYPGGSYYNNVYGIDVGELNVNGGSVSITGGSFGVNIRWINNKSGSVNISGGELTIDSNSAIWGGSFVVNGTADKTIVVVTRGEFEEDNKNYEISSHATIQMGNGYGDYPMGHPSYFHSYVKNELVTNASVSLDEDALTLYEGETGALNAAVTPERTPVTWTSSDPIVATVDADGVVTAHNRGTATITARAGTASDTCEVTVTSRGGDILIGEVNMSGTVENPVYATTDDDGEVTVQDDFGDDDPWNIKWDGTTLTLRNARVVTNATLSSGIECLNDGREVIIQIEGNNYVKGQYHGINYYFNLGETDPGPITINGSGTLTAVGESGASYGIYTNGLTINGGTINAEGRDMGICSPAHDQAGPITINAGTVNASAAGSTNTCGIHAAGGITINGGVVTATAAKPSVDTGDSYGIRYRGDVVINGGVVTASGTTKGIYSVSQTSRVIINPVAVSEIHVRAGADANSAQSIATITTRTDITDAIENAKYFHSNGFNIHVGGVGLYGASGAPAYAVNDGSGNITTIGADADHYNVMWDGETLTLRDATISGNVYHNSSAVPSIRLVIEGVNSIAANTTGAYNGISANSTGLTISGDGTLEISASTTGINVYSLTIESGTLKITAGNYGVRAAGGVTIKGGEIVVSGGMNAFPNDSYVTADPRAGKQICVFVGGSEDDAEQIGAYTSETTIDYIYTVNKYFRSYTEDAPIVTGVSVSPAGATVEAGKTVQFSATVNGTGGFSQEVTWSVSGGVSAGTSISANGLLTVAADETATSLTVTATASGDSGIYGTATVTVTPPSTPDEPDVPVWPVFPGGSTGPDETEEPEDEGLPFIDVHEGDWFYENVGYVYENGLMNGVSETLFEPNGTVTRGMIVTILHRLEGEPESDYDMPFTDVAEQQWYAGAVRWAAGEGIVTGVSATEFAPDDPITREQFAAILWRYAQSKGYDVSASADLTGFLDYGQISEYALPALQWAVGAGVMSGRGDGILAPQGTATRAEAAAMLMRFVENVK